MDTFRLTHGFWEAKDERDDLEREIRRKLEQGYPRNNIIFQAPERAILVSIARATRHGYKWDASSRCGVNL